MFSVGDIIPASKVAVFTKRGSKAGTIIISASVVAYAMGCDPKAGDEGLMVTGSELLSFWGVMQDDGSFRLTAQAS